MYESREYCKDIECEVQKLVEKYEEAKKICIFNCEAYRFHDWLQENGYEITDGSIGVKDKNGKEIHVGDTLSDGVHEGVVFYDKSKCQYRIKISGGHTQQITTALLYAYRRCLKDDS